MAVNFDSQSCTNDHSLAWSSSSLFCNPNPICSCFSQALWFFFFLSTIRPTGTLLHKRLLLVLSDVWQLNCFSAWRRLSAANKQQSPRDSAGDYRRPDFTDLANRVYYKGSGVTRCLITSGGATPSRLAGEKRRWRTRAPVALVSSSEERRGATVEFEFESFGNWEGVHL